MVQRNGQGASLPASPGQHTPRSFPPARRPLRFNCQRCVSLHGGAPSREGLKHDVQQDDLRNMALGKIARLGIN